MDVKTSYRSRWEDFTWRNQKVMCFQFYFVIVRIHKLKEVHTTFGELFNHYQNTNSYILSSSKRGDYEEYNLFQV